MNSELFDSEKKEEEIANTFLKQLLLSKVGQGFAHFNHQSNSLGSWPAFFFLLLFCFELFYDFLTFSLVALGLDFSLFRVTSS